MIYLYINLKRHCTGIKKTRSNLKRRKVPNKNDLLRIRKPSQELKKLIYNIIVSVESLFMLLILSILVRYHL